MGAFDEAFANVLGSLSMNRARRDAQRLDERRFEESALTGDVNRRIAASNMRMGVEQMYHDRAREMPAGMLFEQMNLQHQALKDAAAELDKKRREAEERDAAMKARFGANYDVMFMEQALRQAGMLPALEAESAAAPAGPAAGGIAEAAAQPVTQDFLRSRLFGSTPMDPAGAAAEKEFVYSRIFRQMSPETGAALDAMTPAIERAIAGQSPAIPPSGHDDLMRFFEDERKRLYEESVMQFLANRPRR